MLQKLQDDLKGAILAKDEAKVSTIRFLLAAIKNVQIEKQAELTDEEIVGVIQKQVKQRRESIEGFEKGGRAEMAAKEKQELEILQSYLPIQMSEAEIETVVNETIRQVGASSITDMGKVMGAISAQLKGKADMTQVSTIVKDKLS